MSLSVRTLRLEGGDVTVGQFQRLYSRLFFFFFFLGRREHATSVFDIGTNEKLSSEIKYKINKRNTGFKVLFVSQRSSAKILRVTRCWVRKWRLQPSPTAIRKLCFERSRPVQFGRQEQYIFKLSVRRLHTTNSSTYTKLCLPEHA